MKLLLLDFIPFFVKKKTKDIIQQQDIRIDRGVEVNFMIGSCRL